MNWYIYWYFTIKYFFEGLFGHETRAAGAMHYLFFHFPIGALLIPFIELLPITIKDKVVACLIGFTAFWLVNEFLVFSPDTKRYRRWDNNYRNNSNIRKNCFFVAISIIGTLSWFFYLKTIIGKLTQVSDLGIRQFGRML